MELVYMDGKKEPYTTHDIIAEHAEIDNISVRKLIEKHKKDLEVFGVLSFEIHKPEKGSLGGRPRKVYRLRATSDFIGYLSRQHRTRQRVQKELSQSIL